ARSSAAAETQCQSYNHTHDLIGQQEEDSRNRGHHEDHHGRDRCLTPRRPGDLLALGADFLQKLEGTDFRHAVRLSNGNIRPPHGSTTDPTAKSVMSSRGLATPRALDFGRASARAGWDAVSGPSGEDGPATAFFGPAGRAREATAGYSRGNCGPPPR